MSGGSRCRRWSPLPRAPSSTLSALRPQVAPAAHHWMMPLCRPRLPAGEGGTPSAMARCGRSARAGSGEPGAGCGASRAKLHPSRRRRSWVFTLELGALGARGVGRGGPRGRDTPPPPADPPGPRAGARPAARGAGQGRLPLDRGTERHSANTRCPGHLGANQIGKQQTQTDVDLSHWAEVCG